MKRFETIGVQIMARTAGGHDHDPISSVLGDRTSAPMSRSSSARRTSRRTS